MQRLNFLQNWVFALPWMRLVRLLLLLVLPVIEDIEPVELLKDDI